MKEPSKQLLLFRLSPTVIAVMAAGAFACAPSVPLQNRPCPCSDGWVCCPSQNVCAADENSCPGGGTAGTGGAGSGGMAGTSMQSGGSGGGVPSGPTDGGFAGTPPSDAGPPSDGGLPTLPSPTFTVQPSLLGTWSGYFENFTFPSKSDSLRLSLSQNADGSGKISVVLGMGTPPPPPTDPAATWPPSAAPFSPLPPSNISQLASLYFEGYSYDAYDVHWTGNRLQFVINNDEPWQPYCHLQTSYYVSNNYDCISGGASGSVEPDGGIICYANDGQPNPSVVSCEQAYVCNFVCICDATECGARAEGGFAFDITFIGTRAEGNVAIGDGHDVMLTQIAAADAGQD